MFNIFWRLSYDFSAGNKFDYVIQDMQGVMPSSDNVKSWQISEKLLLPTATCYTLGLLNMASVKLYAHRGWGVLLHWHTVGMIPVASRPGCSPNASCSPVFTLGLLHTHTRLTSLCLGLPRWASTRKVKPIWVLLKQETVSGSGISWAACKSAPRSRQITTPALYHSVFTGRMPFLSPI